MQAGVSLFDHWEEWRVIRTLRPDLHKATDKRERQNIETYDRTVLASPGMLREAMIRGVVRRPEKSRWSLSICGMQGSHRPPPEDSPDEGEGASKGFLEHNQNTITEVVWPCPMTR